MLRTADVATFLAAHGITAPISFQGDIPDVPDEIVILDYAGGLSLTYEQLFDRPAIRVTVRGKQSDPASAEALAAAVDAALINTMPVTIGSKHVTSMQRLGGPPALVGIDSVGGARRVVLAATYIPEIAR